MNSESGVLLLDVDGVLVTPPDYYGLRLLRENHEVAEAFFHGPFLAASVGRADLLEHLPALITALGRTQTPYQLLHEWLEYENHPNPAMLRAVQHLRTQGWRTYLATNQEAHRTRYLLGTTGLGELVDGHFASFAVGHRKPSPSYFEVVTDRLKVLPQQIVFWDDTPENVHAAQQAGWQAHLYTTEEHFTQVMRARAGLD